MLLGMAALFFRPLLRAELLSAGLTALLADLGHMLAILAYRLTAPLSSALSVCSLCHGLRPP